MTHTIEEVRALYHRPLMDLVYDAATVHRANHDHYEMQMCTLLSIKTGGCTEDCGYCSQSVHNEAELEKEILLKTEKVLEEARKAKEAGSTRFCMGAAWPRVLEGRAFDRVCDMVKGVSDMGMESCVTLGMLTENQARRLKEAGLKAYNHNLDTSEEFYGKIITTRSYQDRLDTLENVAKAGISACCGGILGMGESEEDRISLLHTLCNLNPQPESVPINMLVPVKGTPLENVPPLDIFEWIRAIAVARILMPKSMVRLSAGRLEISKEAQALAFFAGANAIFTGEKLLTTSNPEKDFDYALLDALGMKPRAPFKDDSAERKSGGCCKPGGCGCQKEAA
ncbi:MAG: biotin synthase BioB [Rhodospirillales bacterium]|nr:biotin synthase BioB [Alphaproteobacteria bacterium]MCB9981227.1 biotin synthase BioB [Rhodospirillales bacterium]